MLVFEFQVNPALPPNAWCALLTRGQPAVQVEHGANVDTWSNAFAEGAWNDDFTPAGLARASLLMGSGGWTDGEAIVFAPTQHALERIYSLQVGETQTVSNSFAYLLRVTGSRLSDRDWMYESRLMSFQRGYRRSVKQLSLAGGRTLQVHYQRPFRIDTQLQVRTEAAPQPAPEFSRYEDYYNYLVNQLQALQRNADHPERRQRLTPLTTLSSGYDSVACAVLGLEIGCNEALTFPESRMEYSGSHDSDDSGKPIASLLGIPIQEYSRAAYLERTDLPEVPFIASGSGGDDVIMATLDEVLAGRMLLTGMLGDTIWSLDKHTPEPDPDDFWFEFPSGGSLQEFRLSVGFVHVPVPLLTFDAHCALHRISHCDDMQPWRLGNSYDRPIPRRMAEEAGVPRAMFGQQKHAVTMPLWIEAASNRNMSAHSLADFRAFRDDLLRSLSLPPTAYRGLQLLRWAMLKARRVLASASTGPAPDPYLSAAANEPLRFHWAMARRCDAYRSTALSAGVSSL